MPDTVTAQVSNNRYGDDDGIIDWFDRPDGGLGDFWTQSADVLPGSYNTLAIRDHAVVIPDPDERTGPDIDQSIGAAWHTFPDDYADNIDVGVLWNGVYPYEATGLLCIDPTTTEVGVGSWPAHEIFGEPGVLVNSALMNPPEDFADGAISGFNFDHTDGTPRWIHHRLQMPNITLMLDGVALQTFTVPSVLRGSSTHGFSLDQHFAPLPNQPGILAVAIQKIPGT